MIIALAIQDANPEGMTYHPFGVENILIIDL